MEKEQSPSQKKPQHSHELQDCIPVHPLSSKPNAAWIDMQTKENRQTISIPPLLPLSTAIRPDHVRFVCISDTHSMLDKILNKIPPGDVLIHAGDFTYGGGVTEVEKFNEQLGRTQHQHRIVISGNHEDIFSDGGKIYDKNSPKDGPTKKIQPRDLLTNCTYLEDESVTIYGIKIYGSPWQPRFGGRAFSLLRGKQLMEKWARIPTDTDVLVTHGPPVGHGDLSFYGMTGKRAGCVDLLNVVEQRVKPAFHIFGHIHEGYGLTSNNQGTVFINASTCNAKYRPVNDPIIFDFPLPSGITK
uniref:Calcineurin-like phosphoesterase domain-containing protein n=1 Tax=Plectus sambesii TaxID=2011161 RepID=A0A914ULV5_9BILA